jgi:hypothetical protein
LATDQWFLDAVLWSGLTVSIGLVYWIVDAPLYNPYGSIGPWVYGAFFNNFDFAYHYVGFTY